MEEMEEKVEIHNYSILYTEEQLKAFDKECEKLTWLKDIKMTDFDLLFNLSSDLGFETADSIMRHGWADHWGLVVNAMYKYYYEKGVFKESGYDYIDEQVQGTLGIIKMLKEKKKQK